MIKRTFQISVMSSFLGDDKRQYRTGETVEHVGAE